MAPRGGPRRAGAADLQAGEGAALDYDGRRAQAFAHAVEGRTPEALEELTDGLTEEWPFPSAYAVDIARMRFLAGDYRETLDALQLSTRGAEPVEPAVAELTLECVRRDRSLWRHALRVALARGNAVATAAHGGGRRRARRSPTMPR